jgi:thymidylate kinase
MSGRIGLTGAGGVGKTTVFNLLNDVDLPKLGSVTRRVWNRWGITEADQENMSPEDRLKLQFDIFAEREKAELEIGDDFISDRTLLCHYAYCVFRNYGLITDKEFEDLELRVVANLSTYDWIFYFPMTFTPHSDGLRQTGNAYNACIDGLIFRFLEKFSIPYVRIKNGTPEVRAEQIYLAADSLVVHRLVHRSK